MRNRTRPWNRSLMEMRASQMRAYAETYPWTAGMRIGPYRQRITAGLLAEFYRDTRTGKFVLALVRQDHFPNDEECARVQIAFGAPPRLTEAMPPYRVNGSYVCKFIWKERHAEQGKSQT